MTFTDALAKLRSMTKGYCSIKYSIAVHEDGTIVPECSVYTPLHGTTYPRPRTWEEALQDLQDKMDGVKRDPLVGAPE